MDDMLDVLDEIVCTDIAFDELDEALCTKIVDDELDRTLCIDKEFKEPD